MPFDDVYGFPPVAVPAVERHDAATCCGERQEPDVEEGWVGLGPDEILQTGDECDIGVNEPRWVVTQRAGRRVSENTDGARYRRRVTPEVPEAPQSRPSETRASRSQYVNEDNMKLRAENAALRSDVERLRLLPSVQEEIVAWSVDLHDAREEIKRLTAEVERLRLRPDEVELIRLAQTLCVQQGLPACSVRLASIADRLGGGE